LRSLRGLYLSRFTYRGKESGPAVRKLRPLGEAGYVSVEKKMKIPALSRTCSPFDVVNQIVLLGASPVPQLPAEIEYDVLRLRNNVNL